jgi:tetratricopeptide (TPR) repeat protein
MSTDTSNDSNPTPNELYKKGNQLYNSKQYNQSIDYYDKAINRDRSFLPAYVAKGMAYNGLKQHIMALDVLERAIEIDSGNPSAYYQKGSSYYHMKQYDEAIEQYERAIEIDHTYHDAYTNKALCLRTLGMIDKANECLKQAIEYNPNEPYNYYYLGNNYLYSNKYQEALDCYNFVLELQYKFPKALVNKGIVYYYLGNHTEALECLDKALQHDKNNFDAFLNKGIIYYQLGMYHEAIITFSFAIEIDMFNIQAVHGKAICLYMVDQKEGSLQYFNKVIELSPDNANFFMNKAILLKSMEIFDKALVSIQKAQSFSKKSNCPEIVESVLRITELINSIEIKMYRINLSNKCIGELLQSFLNIKKDNLGTERDYIAIMGGVIDTKSHIVSTNAEFKEKLMSRFNHQEAELMSIENELKTIEESSIIMDVKCEFDEDKLRYELGRVDSVDQDTIIDYYYGMVNNFKAALNFSTAIRSNEIDPSHIEDLSMDLITQLSILLQRRLIKTTSGRTFMETVRANPYKQYAEKLLSIFKDEGSLRHIVSNVFKNLLQYIKDDIKLITKKLYKPNSKIELVKKKFSHVSDFFSQHGYVTVYKNNYNELGIEDSDSVIDFLLATKNTTDNIEIEILKILKGIYLERKNGNTKSLTIRRMTTVRNIEPKTACRCIII